MRQIITVMAGMIFLIGSQLVESCNQQKANKEPKLIASAKADDTRSVPTLQEVFDDVNKLEIQTKALLNQYYKAGWLDARNEIIDLYNKGKFTDNNIERVMKKHWRKMEQEIENRK